MIRGASEPTCLVFFADGLRRLDIEDLLKTIGEVDILSSDHLYKASQVAASIPWARSNQLNRALLRQMRGCWDTGKDARKDERREASGIGAHRT